MFGLGGQEAISVFVAFALLFALYILPAIIAFTRQHRNKTAITLVNILLGWSGIGWIVALVWAFTNDPAKA